MSCLPHLVMRMRKAHDKIKNLEELKLICQQLKRDGKRVVLANGVFDIIHVGHIRYLEGARECGDVLIVAINSDNSARRLKGAGRPVVPEDERAEIVAALEVVDYVVLFDEDRPERIIEALQPDVQAKGRDYTVESVPERALVERLGGKVCIVGDEKTHASSDIIRRIYESRQNCSGEIERSG